MKWLMLMTQDYIRKRQDLDPDRRQRYFWSSMVSSYLIVP